jgi:hypothetical protein
MSLGARQARAGRATTGPSALPGSVRVGEDVRSMEEGARMPTDDSGSDRERIARVVQLIAGFLLFGGSLALLVRSELALDPWDVFHQGLCVATGLSIGTCTIAAGAVVLSRSGPARTALEASRSRVSPPTAATIRRAARRRTRSGRCSRGSRPGRHGRGRLRRTTGGGRAPARAAGRRVLGDELPPRGPGRAEQRERLALEIVPALRAASSS